MKPFPCSLLIACLVSLSVAARDVSEHSDLSLAQRQLTLIEHLADRASNGTFETAEARYRFDYSKLTADLERVRQGIHKYLSPSRAQPAEMVELTGDYRAEAPHSRSSDEHD